VTTEENPSVGIGYRENVRANVATDDVPPRIRLGRLSSCSDRHDAVIVREIFRETVKVAQVVRLVDRPRRLQVEAYVTLRFVDGRAIDQIRPDKADENTDDGDYDCEASK
jgi:hypothetical protein